MTDIKIVKTCQKHPPYGLPIVTGESIEDRSKSDVFTKAFAIIQSTWLIVQSISRLVVGLPITELELATMAYVLCAVTMYGLWWYKPFGVEHVTVVQGQLPAIDIKSASPQNPSEYWEQLVNFPTIVPWFRAGDFEFNDLIDILTAWGDDCMETKRVAFILYLVATVFSTLHLAAWNWSFSAQGVRTLWRVFGLVATASALFCLVCPAMVELFRSRRVFIVSALVEKVIEYAYSLSYLLVGLGYIASRVGLIVLIIYSFKSMPAGVYDTVDWTKYIPHFS